MIRQFYVPSSVSVDNGLKIGLSAFISFFIVTFNNVGLDLLLQRSTYYRDLLITFIVAFLLIEFIQRVTALLDYHCNWQSGQWRRVSWQAALGLGGGSILIYLISYLEYRLIDPEHVFGTDSFLTTEFPVAILFTLMINGLYTSLSFYRHRQYNLQKQRPLSTSKETVNHPAIICICGQRNISVPAETVALIHLEHGISWVLTFNKEKYRHPETLNELMSQLPANRFFRANRQHIVHISACQSYRSIENGKIELMLNMPDQIPIIISQKTAAAFRKWMEG